MTHTRIKICGITRQADAQDAIVLGADALGLVFYPDSPRHVSAAQAAEIVELVPPFVTVVGLFVNEPEASIQRTLTEVAIDLLQFHGDETPEFCNGFDRPWMKALRVRPELDIRQACREFRNSRGILLDSWQAGVPGGTGKPFDWELAPRDLPKPVVLAGGLNADNVGSAIRQLRPAAVDVSGGVEQGPGRKDREKISQFIAAVRAADKQLDKSHDN